MTPIAAPLAVLSMPPAPAQQAAPSASCAQFIRVEFDPAFFGEEEYTSVGQFVLIPLDLIEGMAKQDPHGDDGVALAFTKVTKLDSIHIVNYTFDEIYDQHGDLIKA